MTVKIPTDEELLEMDYDRVHDFIDQENLPSTETRETMCLSDRFIMLVDHLKKT